MEHCASLGTRATTTKQLGSFPEAKEKDPKTQELTGSVKMKKRKRAEIALPDSPVPTADSPVAPKLHYRTVRSQQRTVWWAQFHYELG